MKEITPEFINEIREELDSENLLYTAFDLHRQIENIMETAEKEWNLPRFSQKTDNILLIGLGGSAIGGDLLRTLFNEELKIPATLCRNYNIPGYVSENTLCICASYSGNTEEALAAYQQCMDRGARIIAVSTGGRLKELAERDGMTFLPIPSGYQPRAALGISFTSQILILMAAGILGDYKGELTAASHKIEKIAHKWKNWKTLSENPPLELAITLINKIPVIYGSAGWMSTMAYRWKCQFNENAKRYAIFGEFPELNHNEVVGWEGDEGFYEEMSVIFLRNDMDHPRIRARMDLTADIIREKASVAEIWAEGSNNLEKLFFMVLFGDLLAIYLAYLIGREPADISVIHRLKAELAKL